jgi:hypothetical protein
MDLTELTKFYEGQNFLPHVAVVKAEEFLKIRHGELLAIQKEQHRHDEKMKELSQSASGILTYFS